MAKAYQCDRCGKFYNRGSGGGIYEVAVKMCERHQDLCPKCSADLEMWMKNEADFVPKEEKEENVRENV